MQRTRRQILDILKKRGRATLEELAREVALSPVTVRVHLSVLQRDDLVAVEEVRGRVGRPYFVYSLTPEAEDLFPKRYHVFAGRLLRAMDDELPVETVARLMKRMAADWAEERMPRVDGLPLAKRVAVVSEIRTEEGAIAQWEEADGGYLLRQYNCPNLAVSQSHCFACEVEAGYLEALLGAPIERTECIGKGDRTCTYLVRQTPAG